MAKKKPASRKLTVRVVTEALTKSFGNVSAAARSLAVSRTAIYHYINSRPELWEQVLAQRETVADEAEAALFKAVLKGEPWAVTLALRFSTRGKERGYGNSQDIDVAGGIEVTHAGNDDANAAVSAMARWLERQGLSDDPDGSSGAVGADVSGDAGVAK